MNDAAYFKRLKGDIKDWTEAGLIAPDQAIALENWADLRAADHKPGIGALSLLAAAAFIIGVLSLLAANWARLPDLGQFLLTLAVFNASLFAGVWMVQRGSRAIGHATLMASAAMFGGAMILIGQSFNIPGASEGLLFFWALGAVAIGYVLRSGPAFALGVGLFGIWLIVRALIANVSDMALLPPAQNNSPLSDPMVWLAAPIIALFGAAAWLRRETTAWHGSVAVAWVWVVVICFSLTNALNGEDPTRLQAGVWIALLGATACGASLYARRLDRWGASGAAGYSAFAGLGGALLAAGQSGAIYAGMAVVLALSAGVVALGARVQHRWLMATGVIAFLIAAATLYLRISGSLLAAGLVLLLAAAALNGLIAILSRQSKTKKEAS